MEKSPCKDCKDRFLGCHESCEKYTTWHKAWVDNKNEISKKRYLASQINSHEIETVRKAARRKNGK